MRSKRFIPIVLLTLVIAGAIGWLAWDQLAFAEAISRDATAPDYLREFAAAQATYFSTQGVYASIEELHQGGAVASLAADTFDREGYTYAFSASKDGSSFSATATPTWRHGERPSYWYVDSTYHLTRASSHLAGPGDEVVEDLSEARAISRKRPN